MNAPFVVVTVVVACARSSVGTNSNGEQSHANFGDVYLHIMGIRSREQSMAPKKHFICRDRSVYPIDSTVRHCGPTRGSARQRISSIKA